MTARPGSAPPHPTAPPADQFEQQERLLALATRLAGATDLPAIVATLPDWPGALGVEGLALYLLAEGAVWRAGEAGLAPDVAPALDRALAWERGVAAAVAERTGDAAGISRPIPLAELAGDAGEGGAGRGADDRRVRSTLLVPLRDADELLGLLALMDAVGDGPAEPSLWALGAQQVAAALARVQRFEAVGRRAEQARVLAETGRAFAQLSVDEAVRRVVELVTDLLGDGSWLALRPPDEGDARILSAYHRRPEKAALLESLVGRLISPGEGLGGRVLQSGETILEPVTELGAVAADRRLVVRDLGVRQRLCVALRGHTRVIGVLMCHVTEPGMALTPADVTLAEDLARQAATAIENAQLYEQAQRREREAALLAEAGRLFNASLELNQVLPWVVELAVEEIGDAAFIFLLDEQGEEDGNVVDQVPTASSFAGAELGARWREYLGRRAERPGGAGRGVGVDGGLRDEVARSGEPLLVADPVGDPRVDPEPARSLGLRSWLGVPLLGQYGTLGLLTISSSELGGGRGRRLDEGDLRLATALGQRAAMAIENARLYQQAQRREREAALLAEATRRFNASLDLPITLATVVELTGRALADTCSLFLVQPGQPELRLAGYYHPNPDERDRRRQLLLDDPPRLGEGLIGRVAAGGAPVLVRDLQAEPPAQRGYVDAQGLRSWVAVPLRGERDVLGVLSLATFSPSRYLDEGDLALAEAIAERAAAAIEHARLHDDRRRGELLQGTIAALAREVGGTLDPGAVARRLAEALARHFTSSVVGVFLVDRARGEVALRGFASRLGRKRPDDGSLRLRLGQGIVGWVAERGDVVVVPDVGVDPRFVSFAVDEPLATGSELAVPIPGEQGPLGVINLESERLDAFTAEDVYMVRAIARQAAVALENALLHERLSDLAETFRDLVENSPDPFFALAPDGRITVANEALCALTGYDAEELQARSLIDLVVPEDRAACAALLEQVLERGRGSAAQEWSLRRADGVTRVVEIHARARIEDGRPVAIQGVGRDVTERRAQQRALEQRVSELTALHAAGLALAGTHEPGELQTALLRALRAAIPCDAVTLYTADPDGMVRPRAALREGIPPPPTFPRGDGPISWVLDHGRSLLMNEPASDPRFRSLPGVPDPRRMLAVPLLAGGEVRGCIALRRQQGEPFTDDDRRLAESVAAQAAVTLQNVQLHAETLRAAADLRAVLESVEQGVLMTDPAGRIRFANRRLGELLGVDLGGSVGQPLREVAQAAIRRHLRDGEAFLARLAWLLAHPEEVATDEVAVARPVARVLERYSGPVRDPASGELLGRIDVYSDVTEARRLERAKDEFLATASHELKTPITTLNGYLELLQRQVDRPGGPDPERLRRYVATSLGELERLRRLNEDLLEVARIRAGRLTLQPTRTDLAALVRDHVERFVRRPGLLERGHQLVCRADQPLVGQFDPLRLGQVLNNLLENALKYSPHGGDVVVVAERAGDEALVSVHDQGIGVPPEERERLFLPFFRAANASAGSPEGLGLGLYISRGIVEGHGGRLWVEPSPDGGSVFLVALPLDEVGQLDSRAVGQERTIPS